MFNHGVSVFGSSPPVSVVSTGVGEALATSVGAAEGVSLAVGVAEGVALALGVAEGVTTGGATVSVGGVAAGGVAVTVAEGVAVGVGVTAAAHTSLVMVLVSRVTAPLRARSWPLKVAPVVAVIEVSANTWPVKSDEVPKVADEPTCQKTWQGCAPLIS
jgi:hypothetical protein